MSRRTRISSNGLSATLAFVVLGAAPKVGYTQADVLTVTGTVVDQRNGAPLQYAVIGVPGQRVWDLTDEAGTFTLERMRPGRFRLIVLRRGYYYPDKDVDFAGPLELRVEMTPEDESTPVGPGRVVGRVLDQESGNPIGGATVRLLPTGQETRANGQGRFTISDVSAGALLIQVRQLGFQERSDTIAVLPGITTDVTVALATGAMPLDPINILGRSPFLEARGFYRRSMGSGWQANRSAIEAEDPFDLERIFSRVSGVQMERDQFGGAILTSTRGSRCPLAVYVDGIRAPGFDLNSMPPDAVEALEVYQGVNVPAEYSNSCGVVLIWMRRAGREEYRNRSRDSQEVNSEVKL